MTCPRVCGWHTSPSENLCIQQVPAGCSRRRVHPQKDSLRLDVNTQEAVPQGCALSQRKDTDGGWGSLQNRTLTRDSVVPSPRRQPHRACLGDVPPVSSFTLTCGSALGTSQAGFLSVDALTAHQRSAASPDWGQGFHCTPAPWP